MGTATHEAGLVLAAVATAATRSRLMRVAGRIAKSDADAEDAVQEALIQALTHAESFRSGARVSTWLHRIAVNAALMGRRRRARQEARVVPAGVGLVESAPGGGAESPTDARVGFEEALIEEELRDRLRDAVAALAPSYRVVVERCVFGEQPPTRVARDLGMTTSAVRTRLARAREQLSSAVTGPAPARRPKPDIQPRRAARPALPDSTALCA